MSTHLFKYYCKNCAWSEKLVSNIDLFQRQYENAKSLGRSSPNYLAALRAYDRARMNYVNHQLNPEEEAEQSQAIQGKGLLLVGKDGEEVHHPRQHLKQVATSVLEWTRKVTILFRELDSTRCKSIGLKQITGSISNTREVFSGTCPENMRLRLVMSC